MGRVPRTLAANVTYTFYYLLNNKNTLLFSYNYPVCQELLIGGNYAGKLFFSSQTFDSFNRSFDRSDSWHHSKTGTDIALRPSVSRSDAPSPATSTATGGPEPLRPWESALPPPPLPAPDYSPPTSRRLKSALKPTY